MDDVVTASPRIDRRSEPREQMTCLVKLDVGMGIDPFTCFVWDISAGGVRLKLSKRPKLPAIVHVLIGNVRKKAHVMWQRDDHLGLKFVD
jgi:hypothetical protein